MKKIPRDITGYELIKIIDAVIQQLRPHCCCFGWVSASAGS